MCENCSPHVRKFAMKVRVEGFPHGELFREHFHVVGNADVCTHAHLKTAYCGKTSLLTSVSNSEEGSPRRSCQGAFQFVPTVFLARSSSHLNWPSRSLSFPSASPSPPSIACCCVFGFFSAHFFLVSQARVHLVRFDKGWWTPVCCPLSGHGPSRANDMCTQQPSAQGNLLHHCTSTSTCMKMAVCGAPTRICSFALQTLVAKFHGEHFSCGLKSGPGPFANIAPRVFGLQNLPLEIIIPIFILQNCRIVRSVRKWKNAQNAREHTITTRELFPPKMTTLPRIVQSCRAGPTITSPFLVIVGIACEHHGQMSLCCQSWGHSKVTGVFGNLRHQATQIKWLSVRQADIWRYEASHHENWDLKTYLTLNGTTFSKEKQFWLKGEKVEKSKNEIENDRHRSDAKSFFLSLIFTAIAAGCLWFSFSILVDFWE